jgi:hypothetical protein
MSEARELKRVVSSVIVKAVDFYFRSWTNQEDRMWFWLVWRCLEQSGKTVYVEPDDEYLVLGYVPLVAAIYVEFSGCLG